MASQSWSGNGSATITDTSTTTFQVGLSYSMTVGSNSASISYLIPGTVTSNGTILYGGPGNEEAGEGSLDLNGATTLNSLKYSYKHILNNIDIVSDIHATNKKSAFNNDYEFDEFRGIIIGPVSSPRSCRALLRVDGLGPPRPGLDRCSAERVICGVD